MKKFKVGDVIETKNPEGSIAYAIMGNKQARYEVISFEGGFVRAKSLTSHLGSTPGALARISNAPERYRLIERPGNKKRQIENLTKALAESQKEATELNQTAAGAMAEKELLERQIEVDAWARDEVMFEAGYVSIRALKALLPRHGITKRGDARGHVEADLLLYRRNGAVGKMFDALLKELTGN